MSRKKSKKSALTKTPLDSRDWTPKALRSWYTALKDLNIGKGALYGARNNIEQTHLKRVALLAKYFDYTDIQEFVDYVRANYIQG
jgi:hypothetical protein